MKKLSNLLAALVFASLVIVMSCGGGGGGGNKTNILVTNSGILVDGNWSSASVTLGGDAANSDWSAFSLNFTGNEDGGNYTVSGVPTGFETVWSNGTWEFANDQGTSITRSMTVDGVDITTPIALTITETTVSLNFSVTQPARTSEIGGNWSFAFARPQ